jgi:outer membrane autotransporter protein
MGPVLAGISLGYTHSNISSKNITKNTSAVRSYLANLYGSYDFHRSYIDFMLSLAQHNNKSVRNVPVGLVMFRALSDYPSSQRGARLAYSYPLHSGCLNITPSLSAAYTGLSQRGYVERGAGSVGLNVERLRHHVLDLGFGIHYDYSLHTPYGDYIPQFAFTVRHDVIGKPIDTHSTFIIGGPAFNVKGAPIAKTTLDLSAGFNMVVNESFNYVANLNLSMKKNVKAQSATLTLRYRFG